MSMNEQNFNIQKIQNHDPGWNDEWNRLVEAILEDLRENCRRLYRRMVTQGYPYRFGEKSRDPEDFFSDVICHYTQGAFDQTLFEDYDFQWENPRGYLCSMKHLTGLYYRFYRQSTNEFFLRTEWDEKNPSKKKKRHAQHIEEDSISDPGTPWSTLSENEFEKSERQKIAKELVDELEGKALVINSPKGQTIREQAGIQLFPRLSKTDQTMLSLKEDVTKTIAEVHSCEDTKAQKSLLQVHQERDSQYDREIKKRSEEIENRREKGRDTKILETRETQLLNIRWERIFCPLIWKNIVELLKVSEDCAKQRISRYRQQKEVIFQTYRDQFLSRIRQ